MQIISFTLLFLGLLTSSCATSTLRRETNLRSREMEPTQQFLDAVQTLFKMPGYTLEETKQVLGVDWKPDPNGVGVSELVKPIHFIATPSHHAFLRTAKLVLAGEGITWGGHIEIELKEPMTITTAELEKRFGPSQILPASQDPHDTSPLGPTITVFTTIASGPHFYSLSENVNLVIHVNMSKD